MSYRHCQAAPAHHFPKTTAVKQWQQALLCRTSMTTANTELLGLDCTGRACHAVHGPLLVLNPSALSQTLQTNSQHGLGIRVLNHEPAPSPPVSWAKEASLPCTLSKAAGSLARLLCSSSSGSSSLSVLKASLGSVSWGSPGLVPPVPDPVRPDISSW